MDSPVTFGPTISPVCLPSAGSTANYEGKVAAVIGWGALKEGTKTKLVACLFKDWRLLIIGRKLKVVVNRPCCNRSQLKWYLTRNASRNTLKLHLEVSSTAPFAPLFQEKTLAVYKWAKFVQTVNYVSLTIASVCIFIKTGWQRWTFDCPIGSWLFVGSSWYC